MGKKPFTAPVAFVSKGVLDPGALAQSGTVDSKPKDTPQQMPEKPARMETETKKRKKETAPPAEKLADWDVTGKASKMMKLMGYSGGGLGKEGRGIAEAVSAGPVRPRNMGLAFNNYRETKTELKREDEEVEVMDEEEDFPQTYWKKGQPRRPKKQAYVSAKDIKQPGMKIVDMTRGAPIVITDDLDSQILISGGVKTPYLPELFYNLQTILVCNHVFRFLHSGLEGKHNNG